MSDLFEDEPNGNAPEFTVSELSGAVKRTVEGAFDHVRVRGEVGRVSRPRSGHIYLDLKDDRAVLAGVIWKGVAGRLQTPPEEGMEVVATGRLTTFPGQSKYQIVIESLAPAGLGALMAMLEKRKAALAAEGLFAAERKRPLPYLPEVVGVVTSPSGAVIRDILHRLRDRFPRRVLLWPVAVQGRGSAEAVAAAIRGFNALAPAGPVPRPDVLIVARGGGSVEDLWGFNEEIVVRAAADSGIPLISAVGHETDTTLIDLAADRRAPTPSAAAEMAVPVRAELLADLAGLEARRTRAVAQRFAREGQALRDLARALPRVETLVTDRVQRLDGLAPRLTAGLRAFAQAKRLALNTGAAGRFAPGLITGPAARQGERLGTARSQLGRALLRRVERAGDALRPLRLSEAGLTRGLAEALRRWRPTAAALDDALLRALQTRRDRVAALERLRQTMGYRATLRRGFAVVRDGAGHVVTARETAANAAHLELEFQDGRLPLDTAQRPKPRKPRAKKPQATRPCKRLG
ncbi:MAG: exodeoxyribonuclease VII large subunit [Pseudomonadota bacterium]